MEIIYEDNHLIAVNKKGGDLAQKDKTGDDSLIEHVKNYIKIKYNKPGNVFLGSVHRLDRPSSGLIIFARTSKALPRMNALFMANSVKKSYLALVEGKIQNDKDRLEHFLRKDTKKNKSFTCKESDNRAKKAILEYKVIRNMGKFSLLEIHLFTGRHHQIRSQLGTIGLKIVGDLKYGYHTPNLDKSICLHCYSMEFVHPVKKEMLFLKAELPNVPEWKDVRKMGEW